MIPAEHAAGARRAPAAFLFLALAVLAGAGVAGAHGPEKKPSRAPFPPGAPVPPALPVVPLPAPVGTGPGAMPTTGVKPLRTLAAEATVIVLADVARTESHDEDRLRVYRLHVTRVLRGRLDETAEPGVVDVRGATARPPLLAEGERAVLLLQRAQELSYVAQHVPGERLFAPVGERDGIVRVGSEAEAEAAERALADAAAVARLKDVEVRPAIRRLAFAELGGPSPRLVTDALVELRAFGDLDPLTSEETAALGRALRDVRVDQTTRVGLLDLVAERRLVGALPVLQGLQADAPAVLDALLAARARLGMPASRAELAPYLGSSDVAVRAAGVHALARLEDAGALAEVGRYATSDKDLAVRAAAIEALGATKRPGAVPILAKTFDTPEREIMQKSAQAFLAIGGPEVEKTLFGLALHGKSPETQSYAALLLVMSVGRDHPTVKRLEASNPSPAVRDFLEHGLEFLDTHGEH